jgi:hypothetical protein
MYVEALKKARTSLEDAMGRLDHALVWSTFCSQSYLACRAMEVSCRSGMPRPPRSVGRQTVGHVTMHFPLTDPSFPVHRNLRQMLLISSIAHGGSPSAMMVQMGMAERTDLIQMSLPLLAMSGPWQLGSLLSMLAAVI